MRTTAIAILLFTLALPINVAASDGIRVRDTAHEEDVMNAFRQLCLDKHGEHKRIEDALRARDGTELPPSYAKGVLGGKKGRSWKVDGHYGIYIVSLISDGTCQVYGYRTNPAKMLELYERDMIKIGQRKDVLRSEIRLYYTIRYKRPGMAQPEEMLVMLQRSTHSRADSVILSTQVKKSFWE
ncbi:MAG: hypothetical protein AB7G06_05290 [Bdellovibrionales bacterium]